MATVSQLAGPLRDQPVERLGAGLHLVGHAREGARQLAQLVLPLAHAGQAPGVEAQVLEGRGRGGDAHDGRGDVPGDVEPADQQRAQDADAVEQQEQVAADLDRTRRGRHRLRHPRLDPGDEAVDVARQQRRDRARTVRQGGRGRLLDEEGAARREHAALAFAEVDEALGEDAQDLPVVAPHGAERGPEPVGRGFEALAHRSQEIGVGNVGGLGQQAADQVALDAELHDRGVVEQRGLRHPQLLRNRRDLVERAVSGHQEHRRIVDQGSELLDQAAMQLDGGGAALGQLFLEQQLAGHRLVELLENGREVPAGIPDARDQLGRRVGIGRERDLALDRIDQPGDDLLLEAQGRHDA
ncbi:MAG TPA: hypothetical protein VK634_11380, partial [Reyranella sp.]|nr:hypothetical protein [Reyranella sp.]